MHRTFFVILILLASFFSSSKVFSEEAVLPVEPQIVIRHSESKTFYEHRVNGIITEIKVVPDIGPVYYLVPANGDGWIREERSQMLVPKWILFDW